VITPDSPGRPGAPTIDARPGRPASGPPYSTRRRTALVFTGTGTAGAYHAGVLRALAEAGIKIDLVAGRGAGAVAAFFAAVDGGARLWDASGLWRSPAAARFYRWRAPLRAAAWALGAAAVVFAIPLVLLAGAVLLGVIGLLMTLVGLAEWASAMSAVYSRWIDAAFAPAVLPTIIPRLVLLAVLVAVAALAAGVAASVRRSKARRRIRSGLLGRLIGSPLSAASILRRSTTELWNLIRGAAPLAAPPLSDLARRYTDLLAENFGQPGFRELLVAVHDADARRDVVFALLGAAARPRFFANRPGSERQVEVFDLAGVARDHTFDALAAALAVPIAVEPHLTVFHAEGPWRGETHRLCDRPGALARLVEEVAAAGAEQVILAAACPPPAEPHEMSSGRADLRGRAGDQLAALETAGLRDVLQQYSSRFAALFVIRPSHNPLGPFDFSGVYDERSDRVRTVGELVDRGYDDAYRQFIEPVVGAEELEA
jgi:Patatin-like phospholipase